MKKIILMVGIMVWCTVTVLLVTGIVFSLEKSNSNDLKTKRLCQLYAQRNHRIAFTPERWQWFADQGVDLNQDFDWYSSCLENNGVDKE